MGNSRTLTLHYWQHAGRKVWTGIPLPVAPAQPLKGN